MLQSTRLETATARSPIGRIVLFAHEGGVCGLDFADHAGRLRAALERRFGHFTTGEGSLAAAAAGRLAAYFAGELDALDAIPVDPGGTSFHRMVWSAMRRVPAGQTISYGVLAARVGRPGAARAVGAASGRNPVGIVIPCHRVVGASGALTGYGGGLERKRWLLEHEARHGEVKHGVPELRSRGDRHRLGGHDSHYAVPRRRLAGRGR